MTRLGIKLIASIIVVTAATGSAQASAQVPPGARVKMFAAKCRKDISPCVGSVIAAYDMAYPNQTAKQRDQDVWVRFRDHKPENPKLLLVVRRFLAMADQAPELDNVHYLPLLVVATRSVFDKEHWFAKP